MLLKLISFGKKKGYFNIKPLKDIDKCPCNNVSILAIDFDETKEKVCKEANQQSRASCDALIILNEGFDFIEFKRFKEFLKTIKKKEQADKKIEKMKESLEDKIRDSLWILDYIVRHKKLSLRKEERKFFHDSINYFILVDFNLQQDHDKRLAFKISLRGDAPSSKKYDYEELIRKKLDKLGLDIIKNVQVKNILPIDCKNIKKHYDNKVNLLMCKINTD